MVNVTPRVAKMFSQRTEIGVKPLRPSTGSKLSFTGFSTFRTFWDFKPESDLKISTKGLLKDQELYGTIIVCS